MIFFQSSIFRSANLFFKQVVECSSSSSTVSLQHSIDSLSRDGKHVNTTPDQSPRAHLSPRLILADSIRMHSLSLPYRRDSHHVKNISPALRWELSRGIGRVEGACPDALCLDLVCCAHIPRVAAPSHQPNQRHTHQRRARPIHIARWQFDHGELTTNRAPWKRHTTLTFPPPLPDAFRPPLHHAHSPPESTPPRRNNHCYIYVLTTRPPSTSSSCSSSRLLACQSRYTFG